MIERAPDNIETHDGDNDTVISIIQDAKIWCEHSLELPSRRVICLTDPKNVYRPTDVLAVGDLHGNIEIMHKNLRSLGVISTFGRWIGGRQHLVFLGDIIGDRWTDGLQCMREIDRLKTEARIAWGDITVIAGNHENVAISYLTNRSVAFIWNDEYRYYSEEELNEGNNAFSTALRYLQGLGIIEFARDYLNLYIDPTEEGMLMINGMWPKILWYMQKERDGRAMLEHFCQLQIAEQIDDTLFVHTELTSEMARLIGSLGIDTINRIHKSGLENILLENTEPSEDYKNIVNIFLYVHNKNNYLKPEEAEHLRNQGINRVIHGHINKKWAIAHIGWIEIHSVDNHAGIKGSYMDRRSTGRVDKSGRTINGMNIIKY